MQKRIKNGRLRGIHDNMWFLPRPLFVPDKSLWHCRARCKKA